MSWLLICRCFSVSVLTSFCLEALQKSANISRKSISYVPASVGSDKEYSIPRLHNNGLFLVLNSVQSSTRKTYGVGVQAWFNFCSLVKCDPLLRCAPSGFSCVFGFREDLLLDFMGYYYLDLKYRPTTISTYLAAIKFMLKTSGVDISFFLSCGVCSTYWHVYAFSSECSESR